ncbi:MAG: nuclear transport factor 2 family protein [Verrucomicrobiota bacterium]
MALHCPHSMTSMAEFFNNLSLEKLDHLGDVYSPGVEFQDPLHQTRGLPALRKIYEQLLKQLHDVTVTVSDIHGDENTGFLLWTMRYKRRGKENVITGTSHLRFAADGRVATQHDHWDASLPVYGESPLIGWAMRRIKKQTGITSKDGR